MNANVTERLEALRMRLAADIQEAVESLDWSGGKNRKTAYAEHGQYVAYKVTRGNAGTFYRPKSTKLTKEQQHYRVDYLGHEGQNYRKVGTGDSMDEVLKQAEAHHAKRT